MVTSLGPPPVAWVDERAALIPNPHPVVRDSAPPAHCLPIRKPLRAEHRKLTHLTTSPPTDCAPDTNHQANSPLWHICCCFFVVSAPPPPISPSAAVNVVASVGSSQTPQARAHYTELLICAAAVAGGTGSFGGKGDGRTCAWNPAHATNHGCACSPHPLPLGSVPDPAIYTHRAASRETFSLHRAAVALAIDTSEIKLQTAAL